MKRYEIIGFRSDEREAYIFGTSHNEKERYYLLFKAVLSGCDRIYFYEY